MDSFKHSLQKPQTTTGQELSNTVGDDRSVNADDDSTNLTINKGNCCLTKFFIYIIYVIIGHQ